MHCTALQDLAAYLSQLRRQQELTVGEIARLEGGASARTGTETLPQLLELLAALKRVQPIAPVRSQIDSALVVVHVRPYTCSELFLTPTV